MAFNIPNQLPTGMSSFNQGFKGMGDFFDQIKQHQLKQQQLAELMKQHQMDNMFKKRADARAQSASGRNAALFIEQLKKLKSENAMEDFFNQAFNGMGNEGNAQAPTMPHEGAGNQFSGVENPNTGVMQGEHAVDMNGQLVNGQEPPMNGQQMQSGLVAPGNIDLSNRPMVKNPQGGISTVLTMGISEDGKHINIPRVSDDGRILNEKEAIDQFHKTGKHLGIFSSQDEADKAAQQLHEQQANQYGLNGQQMQAQMPPAEQQQQMPVQQESPMMKAAKERAKQDPRFRGAFKKRFGYDLLAETPEQIKARQLETNKLKLDQKAEIDKTKNTNAVKTANQNIVNIVPRANRGIDQLIAAPSPTEFPLYRKGARAAHKALVNEAAENYAKAKGWPNTGESIKTASEILDRGEGEFDSDYRKRLEHLKDELNLSAEEAKAVLTPGKQANKSSNVIEYVRDDKGRLVPKK